MACIFCDIASGKEKGWTIHEDKLSRVVLDAFPVTEGHMLVIPKKHYEGLFEIPEDELSSLFWTAREMAQKAKKSLDCDGFNITTAPAAIPHFHIHIVPRYDYDLMGPLADLDNKRELSEKRMNEISEMLNGAK